MKRTLVAGLLCLVPVITNAAQYADPNIEAQRIAAHKAASEARKDAASPLAKQEQTVAAPEVQSDVMPEIVAALKELKEQSEKSCKEFHQCVSDVEFERAIQYHRVTLSPNGQKGVLVEADVPGFCGSGGCTIRLLRQTGNRFEVVAEGQGSLPRFEFAKTTTNGFYDLIQRSDGHGLNDFRYTWTGSKYAPVSSPASPPPQKVDEENSIMRSDAEIVAYCKAWAHNTKSHSEIYSVQRYGEPTKEECADYMPLYHGYFTAEELVARDKGVIALNVREREKEAPIISEAVSTLHRIGIHFHEPQAQAKALLLAARFTPWACVGKESYDYYWIAECYAERNREKIKVVFRVSQRIGYTNPDTGQKIIVNKPVDELWTTSYRKDENSDSIDCDPDVRYKSAGIIASEAAPADIGRSEILTSNCIILNYSGEVASRSSTGPASPPSPVAAPSKPAVTRVQRSADLQQSALVNRVDPIYPPFARQSRVSGTVRLDEIIGTDGTVRELSIVSGHPLLVQAALNAVQQWRYKPTLVGGDPVEVMTTVDVVFSLTQ